jgi:dynein heavy chain
MKKSRIELTPSWELRAILGDEPTIRKWGLMGLPSDSVSTCNALIASNTRLWPLIIDPQTQGSRWIKKMEKERGLIVLRMNSERLTKDVEHGIRNNFPVLIEEMQESIEPTLNPLVQKQFVYQGKRRSVRLIDSPV